VLVDIALCSFQQSDYLEVLTSAYLRSGVLGAPDPTKGNPVVVDEIEKTVFVLWSHGSRIILLLACGPGLPGWPFLGQISEIWSQITHAGPKIFVCPFSRIGLASCKN